jgi:hypothetical protein
MNNETQCYFDLNLMDCTNVPELIVFIIFSLFEVAVFLKIVSNFRKIGEWRKKASVSGKTIFSINLLLTFTVLF